MQQLLYNLLMFYWAFFHFLKQLTSIAIGCGFTFQNERLDYSLTQVCKKAYLSFFLNLNIRCT
jgi:hypothetical protein